MFKQYKYFPNLSFEKALDAMMDIVGHFNLKKTAPLLFQGKILRVEMIRSEDGYILEICKWVNISDRATDIIIWDLKLKKLAKEMFEVEVSKTR